MDLKGYNTIVIQGASELCSLLCMENSVNITFLRLIQVTDSITSSLLYIAKYYPIVWMYHICLPSPTDGYLDCVQCLAIMNKATMNIQVQVLASFTKLQYFIYIF